MSPDRAWIHEYLEIARTGSSYVALALDCDNKEALTKGVLLQLPVPSWSVWHPSGGCHVVWCLAEPVHRYPEASPRALQFLARVEAYYLEAAHADPGFTGVLADNPVSPAKGRTTRWGRRVPYELHELAAVIPLGWRRPVAPAGGVGRNVSLLRALMRWAGNRAHLSVPVLAAAHVRNREFSIPLPLAEVADIARSVERYRRQWEARGWHHPDWLNRQAERGRRSGKTRRAKNRSRDADIVAEVLGGKSMREVARERGMGSSTVSDIVRRDVPLWGVR